MIENHGLCITEWPLTSQTSHHARLLAGAVHPEALIHRHRLHAGEHHGKRCGKQQHVLSSSLFVMICKHHSIAFVVLRYSSHSIKILTKTRLY